MSGALVTMTGIRGDVPRTPMARGEIPLNTAILGPGRSRRTTARDNHLSGTYRGWTAHVSCFVHDCSS